MAEGVLRELNIARQQPQVYIEHLKARRKTMDSRGLIHRPGNPVALQTQEGYAAIDEAISFLEGQIGHPYPELLMSHGMSKACQDMIDVNGPTGVVGHTGADGSTLMDRLARYGQIQYTAGENIDYGNTDPVQIVLALITDDGVPNRGHRTNIYNPQFKVVGIALGSHKVYGHSCVMDLAGGYIESTPPPQTSNNTRNVTPLTSPRFSMPPPMHPQEDSGPPPLPPKPGMKKSPMPPAPITQPDQLPTLQPSPRKSQPLFNGPPQLPPLPAGARKSVMANTGESTQQNAPPPGVKKALPGLTPTPLQNLPAGAKKAVMLTAGQALPKVGPPGARRQSAPPPVAPGKVATGPVKIAEFSIGADPFAGRNEPSIELDPSQPNQLIFRVNDGKNEGRLIVTVVGNHTIKFDSSFSIGAVTCQTCQTFQVPNAINISSIKVDVNNIVVPQ